MEKATDNIKNPKIRAYFEETTNRQPHTVNLSTEEIEEGVEQFDKGMRTLMDEVDEKLFRAKLGDLPDALSLSYIAQKYFGKSRAWLMQKVNGNTINGKPASFTESERQQFRKALQDLSNRISAVAMVI